MHARTINPKAKSRDYINSDVKNVLTKFNYVESHDYVSYTQGVALPQ